MFDVFQKSFFLVLLVAIAVAMAGFYGLHVVAEAFAASKKRRAFLRIQRRFLVERFGTETAERILRGEVWEGATLEMMSESLGKPRTERHAKAESLGDAVVDFRGRGDVRPVEVHFRSGVVVSWRELE